MLGAFFLILLTRYLTPLKTKWIYFSALQKFEVTFCLNHSPSIFSRLYPNFRGLKKSLQKNTQRN